MQDKGLFIMSLNSKRLFDVLHYKQLIYENIETDNLEKADEYSRKLLNANPAYELKENNNPEDFNRLLKKYTILPLISIGIRNTVLRPNFQTTKVFSVLLDDNLNYSSPYLTTKTLLMYYGFIEYQFKKNISFNVEFTGLNIEYRRDLSKNNYTMTFNEKMTFVECPFYLKKYFLTTKSIFPFANAGLSYINLVKSSANAKIDYTNDSYINGSAIVNSSSIQDIDLIQMRKKNNFLWMVGAGIGFKIKNFGLFVDVRYYRGTNSLTKTSNRFYNSSLINDYFYVDNSIILNKFEGGITILYTIKNLIKKSN